MNKKSVKKEIILLISSFLISIIVAEIFLSLTIPSPYWHDERYGFARTAPKSEITEVNDKNNLTRNVSIQYFEHGFKRWGNLTSNKTKVLIVGDSFTEMRQASNGEEWFKVLEDKYEVELFVYGIGGWGSLQEYMLIEDYYDKVRPDVIIWQFYFNDFANNYYEFDKNEYPYNSFSYRPYLENGKIVYRLPLPNSWFREHSKIAELVLINYDLLMRSFADKNKDVFYSRNYGDGFWKRNFSESLLFRGHFNDTLAVTEEIFQMGRNKAGKTPMYLFSADSRLEDVERKIAQSANMSYIQGVALEIAKYPEEEVLAVDGHWNPKGNKIAGEYISDYFEKNNVFRLKESK